MDALLTVWIVSMIAVAVVGMIGDYESVIEYGFNSIIILKYYLT